MGNKETKNHEFGKRVTLPPIDLGQTLLMLQNVPNVLLWELIDKKYSDLRQVDFSELSKNKKFQENLQ